MVQVPSLRSLLPSSLLLLGLACGGGGGSNSSAPPAPVVGPTLTTAPAAQAGYVGDRVTFSVVAQGTGHSYQWLRNGTAISGATAATYPLTVAAVDDQARFSVKVTASTGGITTSPEVLLDVLYADPAVVAGHDHALAITTKGKVYAWGVGGNGQLGVGDYQARQAPAAVTLPGPAVQVAAGWGHSLALLADGRVFAWGSNSNGQLGDGTTTMRNAPAAVPNFTGVVYIACGYDHNFAVKADNTMWMWGYNAKGQLGLGDKVNRLVPTQIGGSAAQVQDVALGMLHTLLVSTSNVLSGCGDNGYGQLGLPYSSTTEYLTFTSLASNIKAARTFALNSFALATNGAALGTGENVYGSLGDGTLTTRYSWVSLSTAGLPAGATVADIIPGLYHTHLLSTQGAVASMGYNWYGQQGTGSASTTPSTTSNAVTGLNAWQVSAGSMSSYAVLPDLTVKAWGYNNNGRLGDGTATDRPAPVTVPGLFLGPVPTGVAPPVAPAPLRVRGGTEG